MSYESGSLLSIGAGSTLEQVIVLSDSRVATKLFAGKPVQRRDILPLSDWLMLAEGQDVIVTSKTPQLPPSPAPELATPVAVIVAAPVPEVYAIGTMLRWIKDDENKRVALVLKDGVLQVKEMINGARTLDAQRYHGIKRTFFKDVTAWKASLPEGGAITAEPNASSYTSSVEEKTKKPIEATTDSGYIVELTKRYLVRSSLDQQSSIKERIEGSRNAMKSELQRFAVNMNVDDRNIDRLASSSQAIAYYAKWVQRQLFENRGKTPEEMNEITYRFNNYYKQKLFAYKNGLKYEICAKGNILALAPSAEGSKYRGNAVVGNSFADLGIEMKADGKPRLEVSYYRRRIEL
jgi:hypothetical protein